MAARKTIWTPEIVRQRIQASQLARRVLDQALGKVEMTKNQLDAAKFLLERIIPKSEAPKHLDITGRITLDQLLGEALNLPVEASDRPASHSH